MAAQIYNGHEKEPSEKTLAEHMADAVSFISFLNFFGNYAQKQGEGSEAANGKGCSGSPTESVAPEAPYLTRMAPADIVKGGIARKMAEKASSYVRDFNETMREREEEVA